MDLPKPPGSSAPALPPAVRAFDETAPRFDERFGEWLSVSAQRRAVRRCLTDTFPAGGRLLELGGGTGDDALYMLERGYRVTLTDGSPRMVERATAKLRQAGWDERAAPVEQVVLEELGALAERRRARGEPSFDGAYSNFAALNCVEDLTTLAAPLADLLRPGAACMLVVFGPFPPGEVLVELLRGRPRSAFRRLRREAPARIGREHFRVWYPSPGTVARALAPHFTLRGMHGIGVLVPPSAAEPEISRFPRLVAALEAADRVLAGPLARLADHVLLHLERTATPA